MTSQPMVTRTRQRRQRGNALLEFAVAFPLLILLIIGSVDIARSLYDAIAVAEGAYEGSAYGTLNNVYSSDTATIQNVATASASPDAGTVTATAQRFCDCPSNPATGPGDAAAVDCINGTCPVYGWPRVYMKTTVTNDFNSLFHWATNGGAIGGTLTIGRSVYRRVQ